MNEHHERGAEHQDTPEVALDDSFWELYRLGGVTYDLISPQTYGTGSLFSALARVSDTLAQKEKLIHEVPWAGDCGPVYSHERPGRDGDHEAQKR